MRKRSTYMTICCGRNLSDLPPWGCGCATRQQAPDTIARVLEIQRQRGELPPAAESDPITLGKRAEWQAIARRRALEIQRQREAQADRSAPEAPQTSALAVALQRRRGLIH
ncbi:MAG TPA: hypothetical protein VNP04_07235 [Alphaproteobacteria bacterium]|nr:hypothetical protein [Alphaproteobacteria bacterium]